MANTGQPVGQLAYQASLVRGYARAITCFAQTANRFCAGAQAFTNSAGSLNPMSCLPIRRGGRGGRAFLPLIGNVGMGNASAGSGGSGYAALDFVTFNPVNGGRPVVVQVLTVSGGAVTSIKVIDPGSGIAAAPAGENVITPTNVTLTQASTTGSGTGATWSFTPAWGWVAPQPNPSA